MNNDERKANIYFGLGEHLGESFNKQYSQFIDVRIAEKHKPKAERNNALIEGYKLLLNGSYGKDMLFFPYLPL